MNHAMRFNNVCARQITGICSIFNAQKGHVLKQAVIYAAFTLSLKLTDVFIIIIFFYLLCILP